MRWIAVLISFVWLCSVALSAQEGAKANTADTPGTGQSAPEETTQQSTYPDGTKHTVHLVKENIAWSENLHGYLITLRAKEEEPALLQLVAWKADAPKPTIKTLKNKDLLSAIDLHTDVKVTQVFATSPQTLEFYGKFSTGVIPGFNTPDGQNKLFMLAGSTGTRLEISQLLAAKQQLEYLGKRWQPTSEKEMS